MDNDGEKKLSQTIGQAKADGSDVGLAGVPDAFERLWAPHRLSYVRRGQNGGNDSYGCPFCEAPRQDDLQALIVHRGQLCFVVLNLFPYNPGHLLVCPYRHVAEYGQLSQEETGELARLSQSALQVLGRVAQPGGFNMGINQGSVGGAGVAAHLHQHIVPRWSGDSNFMPIVARTKVLSQTLSEARDQIARAWSEIHEECAESNDE